MVGGKHEEGGGDLTDCAHLVRWRRSDIIMPYFTRFDQLAEEGFTLEVCRLSDIPLGPEDRLLYARPDGGPILVARAPVQLERVRQQSK